MRYAAEAAGIVPVRALKTLLVFPECTPFCLYVHITSIAYALSGHNQ